MKKYFSIILTIVLLSTNISFADISPGVKNTISDLTRVESDIGLVIRNILSCNYDSESLRKTIRFDKSILTSVYASTYPELNNSNLSDLELRELATIIYVTSLYGLAISGISLYLDNPKSNESFFLDSISEYKLGSLSLEQLKKYIK